MAALASASEVVASQTVKDLVAGSGIAFEDAGQHELKGIPDRWHLYRVVSLSVERPESRYVKAVDGVSIGLSGLR